MPCRAKIDIPPEKLEEIYHLGISGNEHAYKILLDEDSAPL